MPVGLFTRLTVSEGGGAVGSQGKLDKGRFSFLVEADKRRSVAAKEGRAAFEASLKKLGAPGIDRVGESVRTPGSRVRETPEFMGTLAALNLAAMRATQASIGLTIAKYDFAVLDLTEKISRDIGRMADFVKGREH